MKHFFLLILLFTTNCVHAQLDTTDWTFDFHIDYTPYYSSSILLKLDNPNYYDVGYFLMQSLREYLDNNDLKLYKDKACTDAFSKEEARLEIYNFDTVITFNSETFEEQILIFPVTDRDTNRYYQLSQVWKIDAITHQLTSTVNNCAIVSYYRKYPKPLKNELLIFTRFYLNHNQKPIDLKTAWNDNNIIWKVEMTYSSTNQLPIHKNHFNKKLRDTLLSETHLTQNEIRCSDEWGKYQKVDYAFIKKHFTEWSDTVNRRGEITVYTNQLLEKIQEFKVIQAFSFNKITKTFSSHVLAIAPHYSGFKNRFGYYQQQHEPLFWIVYDDDFLKTFD